MFRSATSNVSAVSGCVANGCQTLHHVSCSPSKIPYGGFSPVRLKTGIRRRPSPFRGYTPSKSPAHPPIVLSDISAEAYCLDNPVQRPLALLRVMLSRRIIAYYGLIRASRLHPPAYFLRPGGQLGGREGPQFTLCVFSSVPSSVPRRTWRLHSTVPSPSTIAFAISAVARRPLIHARWFTRGCVTRLQSSLYATARRMARPSPARTFTLELSPPESPPWGVEYDYTGIQSSPVAGFSPARHTALWAASRLHRFEIF